MIAEYGYAIEGRLKLYGRIFLITVSRGKNDATFGPDGGKGYCGSGA